MKYTLLRQRLPGLLMEQVLRDDEYRMDTRHMHSEYEIYYLLEGERYYFIENETIRVKEGMLLFIGKEKIHMTSGVPGKLYYNRVLIQLREDWLLPFFDGIRGITIDKFFGNYRLLDLDENGQKLVEDLILIIGKEAKEKKVGYEQMIRMKLWELMLYTIRSSQLDMVSGEENSRLSAKQQKVNEVTEYICGHCQEPISLQLLSERFFVSKCYLSRIFKEITSFTVNEYVTVQRIKRGRELLEKTDYNITLVSEMSGFESVTYFEKVFKKQMGLTPLHYRKTRKMELMGK